MRAQLDLLPAASFDARRCRARRDKDTALLPPYPVPMPRTLVTLCTYNERENIARLLPAIFDHAPEVDLLIVDDSSPDGTGELANELAADDSRVKVIHRTERGLGGATIAAFRYAVERNYDRVLNLDADFSHPPDRIPDLLAGITGPNAADVCIGSRYVSGGRIVGWPWRRHLMSRGINWYSRAVLRLPVRDTSGAFRAYRGELLARINWDAVVSRGYSVQEELLYHCLKAGATFREVPITFTERAAGASKIHVREGLSALRILWSLRRSPRRVGESEGT